MDDDRQAVGGRVLDAATDCRRSRNGSVSHRQGGDGGDADHQWAAARRDRRGSVVSPKPVLVATQHGQRTDKRPLDPVRLAVSDLT
jgi:hypothetical protein